MEFSKYDDGFFAVNDKNGFLPKKAPMKVLPDRYKELQKIVDEMPIVKDDGQSGLLSKEGAFEKAIDSLLDDSHPEKVNIFCNLGIIYAKLLDWNNSLIYVQKAYEIDNKNTKILYWLAKAYYNLKKYDNAINISKKLNHLDKNNSLARLIIKDSLSNKKFENEKNKKMYQKMFS